MDPASTSEHTLNVQAVEKRTGISTETLRTWERRYGWPRPHRLPNGYRAYSEADVALILAVKQELSAGVSAATAWQRVLAAPQPQAISTTTRSPKQLATDLLEVLIAFDGSAARTLVAEAHSLYPLDQVLRKVIQPVLIEVGERWHTGTITIAQEHFASNALRDSLVTISNYFRPRLGARTIMIGAAPGELHDIGVLMIALLLRRNGHNVLYLGANVAIDELAQALEQARPHLLVLSASRPETAHTLAAVAPTIARMQPPRPLFAFGGRAFAQQQALALHIGGVAIHGDVAAAVARIEDLLAGHL